MVELYVILFSCFPSLLKIPVNVLSCFIIKNKEKIPIKQRCHLKT